MYTGTISSSGHENRKTRRPSVHLTRRRSSSVRSVDRRSLSNQQAKSVEGSSFVARVLRGLKRVILGTNDDYDSDLEDYEQPVERYVPESLEELCKTTNYSKEEVRLLYRSFKQECPTGIVSEEKFKELYSQFFPLGDARAFAGYVFDTLDTEMRGSITFEHFIGLMSVLTRGTPDEKLQWIFNLYDLNGNGYISQSEMYTVMTAVYTMLGKHTIPPADEATMRSHVARVFQKLDLNSDNKITLQEFVEGCKRDATMTRCLGGMFDTIL